MRNLFLLFFEKQTIELNPFFVHCISVLYFERKKKPFNDLNNLNLETFVSTNLAADTEIYDGYIFYITTIYIKSRLTDPRIYHSFC